MSRPEHLPLPTTPKEHSTGFWQYTFMAICHKRHEGAHDACILYHFDNIAPQMFDAYNFDLADAIHLHRYPRCGIQPGYQRFKYMSVWEFFLACAHNATLFITEAGGLVEDIKFEMSHGWVQFPDYTPEGAQHV